MRGRRWTGRRGGVGIMGGGGRVEGRETRGGVIVVDLGELSSSGHRKYRRSDLINPWYSTVQELFTRICYFSYKAL